MQWMQWETHAIIWRKKMEVKIEVKFTSIMNYFFIYQFNALVLWSSPPPPDNLSKYSARVFNEKPLKL